MEKIASGIWRVRLGKPERFSPVKLREGEMARKAISKLPKVGTPPYREAGFKTRISARGLLIEIPLDPKEQIYGFGLQMKSHNQRGLKKVIRVNSDPVADTGDAHAPVPFYVSTKGYGVLVDTCRYAAFWCGAHRRVRQSATKPREASMVIEIPGARGVDVYLFAGPTLKNAVQRYNLFSGGGVLPPVWGLGVWYRTYALADEAIVRRHADYFRQSHVPCDVFGFEPAWQTHSYSCTYTWDKKRFPHPEKLVADLSGAEFKVSLWEHVFTHPDAPFYGELKKLAGDHEVWGGLVPDLSVRAARRIFADFHEREFVDRGIANFKLDECDNSDFRPEPWSFPEHAVFPSGMDGEQMHSMLGVLYQRTIAALYRKKNRRTLGQARSSHALAAPLPFVLYSDLYDHRDYLRALVNSCFSGLLWSPELRQAESIEDLLRRVQSVVFSPHALVNAFQVKNPPWMQFHMDRNNRDELLKDWRDAEKEVRRWFELRMSLVPYLYACMARYWAEGVPPIRALVMEWPEDQSTWNVDNQWLVGDGLLAAPVFWPERSRKVYLPKGGWYDFWTRQRYEGGRTVEVSAPVDRFPLFARENTILPLAKPVEFVRRETVFEITAHVFGDTPAPFTLFEDDGWTYDFEKGAYTLVELSWKDGEGDVLRKVERFPGQKYRIAAWKKA